MEPVSTDTEAMTMLVSYSSGSNPTQYNSLHYSPIPYSQQPYYQYTDHSEDVCYRTTLSSMSSFSSDSSGIGLSSCSQSSLLSDTGMSQSSLLSDIPAMSQSSLLSDLQGTSQTSLLSDFSSMSLSSDSCLHEFTSGMRASSSQRRRAPRKNTVPCATYSSSSSSSSATDCVSRRSSAPARGPRHASSTPQTADVSSKKDSTLYDVQLENDNVLLIVPDVDLVKSHLMFAVREEVDVLKDRIVELLDKINHLEYENSVLKQYASPEALQQLKQHNSSNT